MSKDDGAGPCQNQRNRYFTSGRRFNPRGVKPKICRFNVRHRGEPLHVPLQPTPVARI